MVFRIRKTYSFVNIDFEKTFEIIKLIELCAMTKRLRRAIHVETLNLNISNMIISYLTSTSAPASSNCSLMIQLLLL